MNKLTAHDWTQAWPQLKKVGDEWKGPCPNPDCDADDDGFWVKKDGSYGCRKCRPSSANKDACKAILEGAGLYQNGRTETGVTIALSEDDEKAAKLWRATVPLENTPGATYLKTRLSTTTTVDCDQSLRWLDRRNAPYKLPDSAAGSLAMRYTLDGFSTNSVELEPLTHDGQRLDWLGQSRKRRTVSKKSGCVWSTATSIRANDLNVIAEGAISALAAANLLATQNPTLNVNALALGGTGGVAKMPKWVLDWNTEFWVDGDEAGDKCAQAIVARCKKLGCKIPVFRKCPEGKDAADVLCDKLDVPPELPMNVFDKHDVRRKEERQNMDPRDVATALAPQLVTSSCFDLRHKWWMVKRVNALWTHDDGRIWTGGYASDYVNELRDDGCIKGFKRTDDVLRELALKPILIYEGLWDSEPCILGLPGGMVMDITEPDKEPWDSGVEDRVTKALGVIPEQGEHPTWDKIIDHICINDDEVGWLQRYLGSCLTADTSGEKFVFLQGAGGGGKSTLIETVKLILGDYACGVAGSNLLGRGGGHREWIARTEGRRLLIVGELPGGTWELEAFKEMVSGGTVTANFMRQNSFDFNAKGKFILAGNHKPRIPRADSGLKRRMVLIEVKAVLESLRVDLSKQLKEELEAIAYWMLEGARAFIEHGLGSTPQRWHEATDDYHQSEDHYGDWYESECEEDLNQFTPGAIIIKSYNEVTTGKKIGTATDIYEWLKQHDVDITPALERIWITTPDGTKKQRQFRGIYGISVNTFGDDYGAIISNKFRIENDNYSSTRKY